MWADQFQEVARRREILYTGGMNKYKCGGKPNLDNQDQGQREEGCAAGAGRHQCFSGERGKAARPGVGPKKNTTKGMRGPEAKHGSDECGEMDGL